MRRKKIVWNDKLPEIFAAKRRSLGEKRWTAWTNYLRRLKIKQVWISGLEYEYGLEDLLDVVNSSKKKYVYVAGMTRIMKKRNPTRTVNASEILLVPPKLAQKILVLGGLP